MGFEFCEAHFSKEETNLISLLALISSTISMFGSSYMLLSYFLFSTRKNPLSKLVAWLAFADYLVSLNNIIKTSIIYADPDWYVWPLCVSMRVYFQLTAGATCGYTTCIAFFLWRSLWFHKTRVRRWEWALFHGLSWGIPLVCVVGLVSGDLLTQSPNLYLCFPKKPWHIILWFAPVLASFGLNLLFYLLIIYRIRKIKREQKAYLHATQYHEVSAKLSKVILRFSFYLLVFFVCWVFDVLTYVVGSIDPSCGAIIFTILYSILLNLQGGLDFLVYGVTNDNIYKRFTSRSTVVHSLFEFCLSPLLVFPAFLIYLRKVLRARRSKAARQHLQHMRDPKLQQGSFRSGRLSSVELDSARESGEDEAGLEEDDFEEGHRGVIAAFVRGGGATAVATSHLLFYQHQPPTNQPTNMSSNEPSKMSAYGDKAMGAMKENAGWAMGNKQMETEGKAQGAKGDAQLEAARAEQKAIGEKDKLKGNVKETAGNLLGNEQWQAEGKGDRLKGEAREKMNI